MVRRALHGKRVRRGLGDHLFDELKLPQSLAELLADLPNLKALMTSHHPPTIQDGSREMFRLSGGDLLALVDVLA